jgi:hypothetical protein
MTESSEPIIAKKRGRKPKKSSHSASDESDSHVILQLNVGANIKEDSMILNNYEKNFCNYDPCLGTPNAYDQSSQYSDSQPFVLQSDSVSVSDQEDSASKKHVHFLLHDKDEPMPTRSSYACHWCCHTFDTRCLGMPLKWSSHNSFYVTGNFCSLECATAFNFDTNSNSNSMWETYTMINLMARKMECNDSIYPAPPRNCLKLFGGYMDINTFRGYCRSNNIVNYNKCPLIAAMDQVEEINNFYHKHKEHEAIPIDTERLKNYESRLKLQHDAFIMKHYKRTLDSSMGIVDQPELVAA